MVFQGKITRIDPVADIQKNTVRCKIALELPEGDVHALQILRPDMLARARITPASTAAFNTQLEGIAIPSSTLARRDGSRASVWVTRPDGQTSRIERREIELGLERANGWIEVTSGLAAGDRVVIRAQDSVDFPAGTRVHVDETFDPSSVAKEPDA